MSDTPTPAEKNDSQESLSTKKALLEIQLLEIEYKIKENELIIKEKESRLKNTLSNTLLIAVIGAIIGIVGSLLNTYYQHSNEKEIEQQKFNASLLTKAVEGNDKFKGVDNLKFLKKFGLVKIENVVLDSLLSDSTKYYSIPSIYEQIQVTILDSAFYPLSGMDVYNHQEYIGRTDSLGKVEMTDFSYPPRSKEIEVRVKGRPCTGINITSDRKSNIQLTVKLPT